MQIFFVTYNTGEYDSYCEHVYAINAVSKEALLAEIDRACDEYLDWHHKYRTERQRINDEFRPKNHKTAGEKQWKIYNQELNKFLEEFGTSRYDMNVFGCKIPTFDELTVSGKDKAIADSGLDIMTVEEYIESCRPQKDDNDV